MTKQYKYVEYEKLSDAVRDLIEGNEKLFVKTMNGYMPVEFNGVHELVFAWDNNRYAKRVEAKEETIEAWGLLVDGILSYVSLDRDFKNIKERPTGFTKLEIVPLTRLIKE